MKASDHCVLIGAALAIFVATPATGGEKTVLYGKIPDWVLPPPAPTDMAAPAGAAVRIIYSDVQTRVSDKGDEIYTAYRMKLLTPDALAVGNISAAWNPAAGHVSVHHLRIIRDGKIINILTKTKFEVLRREANLDSAFLDGQLTATIQAPGLQVGDELEFAATALSRDPTLGDHHFGLSALGPQGNPGAFRLRLSWPANRAVNWRASPDIGTLTPQREGDQMVLTYALRDPRSAIPTEGAPPRYNVRRLIEYSDFAGWDDISGRLWPLYDAAAKLAAGSPIRQEVARIAAANADPVARTQAALKLVQDHLRYVYVGMNGGNYQPVAIDQSWDRRFGDCKAKTVLLLALLKELGVPAEAVLVHSGGGDGTEQRLPSPLMFDHVLVRATIAGKPYWLDGTRLGDQFLDRLPPPVFRWALPLRQGGAALEPVAAQAPREPSLIAVLDVDVRGGFDKKGPVKLTHVLRGDETYQTRVALSGMSAEDADRAVESYWRQQADWVEPDKVGWRFDAARGALVLSLTGQGKLDWKGEEGARHYNLHGAGFYAPDLRRRPREQDQNAPWAIAYPRFRCWATTVRLPVPTGWWQWNYDAKPVNRRLGGVAYWRTLSIADNVVRSVMSSRSLVPEISAEEVRGVNDAIAGFDNDMSQIQQDSALKAPVRRESGHPPPPGDEVDWLASATACDAPEAGAAKGEGVAIKAGERTQ